MNEVIKGGSPPEAPKRIHCSVEEKRRIVEATFVPRTSIVRVARERGVNPNQVFQWHSEYRKGIPGGRSKPATKLLPDVMSEPEVASSARAVVHRQDRFRPTGPNLVREMDFVSDQLSDGRRFCGLWRWLRLFERPRP